MFFLLCILHQLLFSFLMWIFIPGALLSMHRLIWNLSGLLFHNNVHEIWNIFRYLFTMQIFHVLIFALCIIFVCLAWIVDIWWVGYRFFQVFMILFGHFPVRVYRCSIYKILNKFYIDTLFGFIFVYLT